MNTDSILRLETVNDAPPGTLTTEMRDGLRDWVKSRHTDYVRQATHIAAVEMNGLDKDIVAELSYGKLRRLREEYEEARKVLTILDQVY